MYHLPITPFSIFNEMRCMSPLLQAIFSRPSCQPSRFRLLSIGMELVDFQLFLQMSKLPIEVFYLEI